jgi:predicted transcriptional regulator
LSKKRDRINIVAAVLDVAANNGGCTKTRIMFGANLSFKLLEKYLKIATNLGFIQQINSHYTLTDKGREFLTHYRLFRDKSLKVEVAAKSLEKDRSTLERLCEPKQIKPSSQENE